MSNKRPEQKLLKTSQGDSIKSSRKLEMRLDTLTEIMIMKYPTRNSESYVRKWISGIQGMSSKSFSASSIMMEVVLLDT